MNDVAINSAEQVLRPPSDGLAYLRSDRAAELSAEPGSLLIRDGTIAGFEPAGDAPVQIDARGCAIVPGFVDCHTHLPFAGWREREYAMKIAGETYEAISRAGGGIRSSARALAEASDEHVLDQSRLLAAEMRAHGTTAFEGKSGYGLSVEGELRELRLGAELGADRMTALLAHAVPDSYDADGWMEQVARMVPRVVEAGQASALDIYVEAIAFSNEHLRRMATLAAEYGLDLRAHVEQFHDNGSTAVAVECGARSVDHLSCLSPDGVSLLAESETAAVLLPGAEFIGDEHTAPGRALADRGAICVLATDLNPGTSPIVSLPLVIGLAVRRYRWSANQALLACTLNAAWVLRLSEQTGSLEPGKRGDVLVLDGPIERIAYRFGHNPVALVLAAGELVHVRPDCAWRVTTA